MHYKYGDLGLTKYLRLYGSTLVSIRSLSMRSLFTVVALLSTVAVAVPLSADVALEVTRHQAPRDSAIVVFAKEDDTLWIGMPVTCDGTQLIIEPNTLTDRATNKVLAIDRRTRAIKLSNAQKSKFAFDGDSLLFKGKSRVIACPSTTGVQLFWGDESMCTNGTRVDMFQSQHILKERRSFLDNAEAMIEGGEPDDASLFGLDFTKRGVEVTQHHRCGCEGPACGCGLPPPCAIPPPCGFPPPCAIPPPCGLPPPCGCNACDGRCDECQWRRWRDRHCFCDLLRPTAWGDLFDCIIPDHCPASDCCFPTHCSARHHETDCCRPDCYCQDPRYYHHYHGRYEPWYYK